MILIKFYMGGINKNINKPRVDPMMSCQICSLLHSILGNRDNELITIACNGKILRYENR